MATSYFSNSSLKRGFKKAFYKFLILLTVLFSCFLVGCKAEIDYLPYVSELRSNILLAETEEFSLRIFAVDKEIPYEADGVPREKTSRLEAYLHAPDGSKSCNLSFAFGERNFQGDMSFDNVKGEYFFSCTLDVGQANELPCTLVYGDQTVNLTARSICTENTLDVNAVLEILKTEEGELFASMTDKYGFSGEIHVRLIYENSPYYYVGIIQRDGVVHAFLINAQTGKILAKRTT